MNWFKNTPKVAILEMKGKIGVGCDLSFNKIRSSIDKAFSKSNLKAVCIVINSPGGSAVQSELIAEYLLLKSQKTGIPLFSFVEDCAASGGYLIACSRLGRLVGR
jgi:ClpP class serine protease